MREHGTYALFVVRRDIDLEVSNRITITVDPCRDVVIPSPVLSKRGDAAVDDFSRIPVPTFRMRGSANDIQINTLLYILDTFALKYHARYVPHIVTM